MALNGAILKALIITEMQGQGMVTAGTYAWADNLAEAIANAVVTHITTSAVTTTAVIGGSSAGSHAGVVT